MKLGIVASEFPPAPGGMQQHALGLAEALSSFYEIVVFTSAQHQEHRYEAGFEVRPVLRKRRKPDFQEIAAVDVDAILTLNAGYAPLSNYIRTPVFCYCHGNDFLNPWIDCVYAPLSGALSTIDKNLRKKGYFAQYQNPIQQVVRKQFINRGLQRARAIFVNSSYTQARLCQWFKYARTPIYVAYPGVPNFFFETERRGEVQRKNSQPVRFLTIARLARHARKKNVDNVLRALSKIKNDFAFNYTILGDGDMRRELETLAADLGVAAQTQFVGNVPNQEIPIWLDSSDFFILPSKASERDVESFGIVYVEAAARGLPSLASRAGGATDAVSDGISGIVLDGSEPDDIAAGIRKYVAQRDEFDRSSIIAFANTFRWERIAEFMHQKMKEHADG